MFRCPAAMSLRTTRERRRKSPIVHKKKATKESHIMMQIVLSYVAVSNINKWFRRLYSLLYHVEC